MNEILSLYGQNTMLPLMLLFHLAGTLIDVVRSKGPAHYEACFNLMPVAVNVYVCAQLSSVLMKPPDGSAYK